jgi:hypothetical protein
MGKPLKVHIPQPCHEKWNEMTPTQKGAFCGSCQKEVIDFTGKTNQQVFEILSKNKGGCGRFYNHQLWIDISPQKPVSSFFKIRALAASIFSFVSFSQLTAKPSAPKDDIALTTIADTSTLYTTPADSIEVADSIVTENKLELDWTVHNTFPPIFTDTVYTVVCTTVGGFWVTEETSAGLVTPSEIAVYTVAQQRGLIPFLAAIPHASVLKPTKVYSLKGKMLKPVNTSTVNKNRSPKNAGKFPHKLLAILSNFNVRIRQYFLRKK